MLKMGIQPAPAVQPASEGIYLGRQSILDRNQDLVAFELLFRSSERNAAQVTDDTLASATVIQHVLNEFGLESVLGQYKGFINLDGPMIMSDLMELLPRDRVVLEVLETVTIDARIAIRLKQLKQAGFTLAIDDVTHLPPEYEAILDVIDIVKIDIAELGMARVPALLRKLKPWPVRLLAEKVDERAQVDQCLALGFELFQGYFFAKPQVISGKRLSPTESTVLRLLGLLLSDAQTDAIESLLKQEPTLAMNLLRLTNSVGVGTRGRVSSVSSAVMVLGRRQLQRWLQLLLYSANSTPARLPGALMQLAATRGRMMELLASALHDKGLEDRAFMTGIMSLMDALLSLPLAEILAPLPVADDIRAALLERAGTLGALLTLVESIERGADEKVALVLATLPILGAGDVQRAHAQALAWANNIGAA
jgi:EAL and modified HD-GYP domain-containing signal transduction protein